MEQNKNLTEDEIIENVKKVKEKNSSVAMFALMNQFKPYMSKLCFNMCPADFEDGMQVCSMALLIACRKFAIGCGIKFFTFAYQEIRGYLQTYLRDTKFVKMSNPATKRLKDNNEDLYRNFIKPDSLETIEEACGNPFKDTSSDVEEVVVRNCLKSHLYDVVSSHPRGNLFIDYYGLFEHKKLTLVEIAEKYKVSPSSVYTIIERLKNEIATHKELAVAV